MEAGDTKRTNVVVSLLPIKTGAEKQRIVLFIEICLNIASLITYMMDIMTDMVLAVHYLQNLEYLFGGLTLVFVVMPAIVTQIISGRWYAADKEMKGCRYWTTHILLLQPLERYILLLVTGMDARKLKDAALSEEFYLQQNDVSMLRLFEAFLESAPQITLQVYIMMCTDSASWLTITTVFSSLIALGWAVAAYSHALRKAYKEVYKVSCPALPLQTLWHVGIVASRVLALVVFASVFQYWTLLFLGMHWMLMTTWVLLQKTDFCPSRFEEFLFNCIVGVIYCFSFFNLKEGHTRWRLFAYSLLMLIENSILVGVWYPYRMEKWYDLIILLAVFILYILGIFCMLLYYRCFHHSGPIHWKRSTKEHPQPQHKDILEQSVPISRPPIHQSTPAHSHIIRKSTNAEKVHFKPSKASAVSLRHQALLKSHVPVNPELRQCQLSPIKTQSVNSAAKNIYTDCTKLNLDETSAFQHFSVDASACFRISKCKTLEGTSVNLSCEDFLDDASYKVTPIKLHGRYSSEVHDDGNETDSDGDEEHSGVFTTAMSSWPQN